MHFAQTRSWGHTIAGETRSHVHAPRLKRPDIDLRSQRYMPGTWRLEHMAVWGCLQAGDKISINNMIGTIVPH